MRFFSFLGPVLTLFGPVLALAATLSWYLPGAKRARQQEAQQVTELQTDLGEAPWHLLPPTNPPKK